MELNLEQGYVQVEDYEILIKDLEKVSKMCFCLEGNSLPLLYIYDGDHLFMYSDSNAYNKLLKVIASGIGVGKELRKYENDFGLEHELWKQLLFATFEKFSIFEYDYADKVGFRDYASDYFTYISKKKFGLMQNSPDFIKVSSIDEAYNLFNSLLPDNYHNTVKRYQNEEAMNCFSPITSVCGNNFENLEAYISQLDKQNTDNPEKWLSTINQLKILKSKLTDYIENGILEKPFSSNADAFLSEILAYANERLNEIGKGALLRQYGSIPELKKVLRDSIIRLDFQELLELFKEYKNHEGVLASKVRVLGVDSSDSVYKQYLDIYRLGGVLISDKMNRINKIKAKNKNIPQELLDEAMKFYYDTDTADDAYSAQANEKYQKDKEGGEIGEQKVDYALKWLDTSYTILEKRSKDRIGKKCIYIANTDYIDEKQEYDHIIVSNKGIFSVETKNYAGKLVIDQYGNWIREKNGEVEGVKNPIQQIRQHEKVLASFLPKECKIISVICIANDKAIIEGAENCIIPIVKSDMLVEFIENYNETDCILSDDQKNQCIKDIYNHML